ncbi:Cysteine desulfurase IscS [bioreactor metagenome]|jgi:cysteine desulfurase|uniref:Cysteine desulfurase IscS n=1 Tax=bioreactor metagenome TaxID=1076179 RepID=A0A644YZF1_9ZZZZ
MIYLDYSANTPADPRVLERFCQVERAFPGNPNSQHSAGRDAKEEMARVTDSISSLLGVGPEEIIYTSGSSESNNTAIKGIARAGRHTGRHIISTPLEHSSVSGCLTALQEKGYEIDLLDVGRNGKVELAHLRELLRKDTVLVAVCAVDSELGTIQPISEIAEILRAYPNCRLHVDATQAVGKTDLTFDGVDTMSLAPHKFYGLGGSGILYKRRGIGMEPLIHGGTSTTLYRSGTPALALAAAAETALGLAFARQKEWTAAVRGKNDTLRAAFTAYPKVRVNSPADAVPQILNLSVQGVRGPAFQKALDECGVCVSVKSACSADGLPSRAVFAVSRDRKNALSSWRVSLSHLTTDEDIYGFLSAFDDCYRKLAG